MSIQNKIDEEQFLSKFRCIEHRVKDVAKAQQRNYVVYDCDASGKVTAENIAEVIAQALEVAAKTNSVIRLFRVVEVAPGYSVAVTITRGGLITLDVRFPPRFGGFQNSLTVRLNEVMMLKMIADKLVELVSKLTI
jgi:6-pyruvoyl-tetrahydropterin synthase